MLNTHIYTQILTTNLKKLITRGFRIYLASSTLSGYFHVER